MKYTQSSLPYISILLVLLLLAGLDAFGSINEGTEIEVTVQVYTHQPLPAPEPPATLTEELLTQHK